MPKLLAGGVVEHGIVSFLCCDDASGYRWSHGPCGARRNDAHGQDGMPRWNATDA